MSLVVDGLVKRYGEKTVVDHLSFQMEKPGVYALLGTNGAGKTTSIRMMVGMLAKDEGETLWNGAPLRPETCNVGYLAEERGLYPKYELMDQLLYFASLRGVSTAEAKKRIAYWAKRLEVTEYLWPTKTIRGRQVTAKSLKADQLSKGNQQKIQLMLALLSEPELLILDEPMSGLDPVNTELFKSIIREEISKGKYLIMSSHQMATVEEFCTDITILNRSKTVLQGNLNDIKRSYGRVNLKLKTAEDVKEIIERSGANLLSEKEREYQLKVSGEAQAMELLRALTAANATIITFDLQEPSLHEIFVEKVGGSDED